MLPTFLVVGAMKAGTTTVHELLRRHPDVWTPDGKEIDFFSSPGRWRRGVGWYETQLAGHGGARAVGEVSPSYAMADRYPEVAERIAATAPGTTIVYLVRDPLARMVSMYRHHVFTGQERRPAAVALVDDPRYLTASRYGLHLDLYRRWFPPERVVVAALEELVADPRGTMAILFAALGVGPPAAGTDWARHDHPSAPKRRPRAALAGRPRWVEHPVVRLDRVPPRLRRLAGTPFPPPETLVPPAVAARLRARLLDDAETVRAHVGPERFARWGWASAAG